MMKSMCIATLIVLSAAETLKSQPNDNDSKPVGVHGEIGCLADPTRVDRLVITAPGTYSNYLVDGNWGTGNRVKIVADDVILRNCEIMNCAGNGVGVFATNVIIENCRIHHCLAGSFSTQKDAHGITGRWGNVTIRNCEIFYVSGDAIQFDPDRKSHGEVTVEDCTLWTGPLPEDTREFKKGERPGENGIDTKTKAKGERCRLIVRNCYFHGWNQPAQIANAAALNLKENVDALVEHCLLRDNELAFRLRGKTSRGAAHVEIRNCAIYDTQIGARLEDKIDGLEVRGLLIGSGVKQTYKIIGKQLGANNRITKEGKAPAFELLLRNGFQKAPE
jgi:hypothetical protein